MVTNNRKEISLGNKWEFHIRLRVVLWSLPQMSRGTQIINWRESYPVPLFNHPEFAFMHAHQVRGLESCHLQLFGEPRFPVCQSETYRLGIHLEAARLDVIYWGSSCMYSFVFITK